MDRTPEGDINTPALRERQHSILCCLVNPILWTRLCAVGFEKNFHATGRHRRFIPVKRIARKAHHLAGSRHITQFSSHVQQTELVFDHSMRNTIHGVTPWRFRAG
jgi:hypothetical protein